WWALRTSGLARPKAAGSAGGRPAAARCAGGGWLALRAPRRLGAVELDPDENRLGPDAFEVTQAQLDRMLTRSRAPVKAVLMDQARLAGLGNLLVDEVLWRAGIDPARPARDLDRNDRRRVYRAVRRTVQLTLERGGSHTGDHMAQRVAGGVCPEDGPPFERRTVARRPALPCPDHAP